MGMKEMPAVEKLADGGVFWKHEYKNFKVKTYVPKSAPITEIVNFLLFSFAIFIIQTKESVR